MYSGGLQNKCRNTLRALRSRAEGWFWREEGLTIPQSMTFSDKLASSPVFSSHLSIASLIVVATSSKGFAWGRDRQS